MSEVTALIDIGGSSIKVSIYSQSSDEIVSVTESASPIASGDTVTQDPSWLFDKILLAMNSAGAALTPGTRIEKVLVSSIRQGFCLVAGEEVLTPLIYNSDTSGRHSEEEILSYGHDRLYNETGHWFASQLTLPKIVQLKRVSPELFHAETRLAFVHDWLVWHLTGILQTEMTLVSSGQLALLSENRVHVTLLEYFGFDGKLIPPLGKFNEGVGGLRQSIKEELGPEWQSVVVHVGGGDSHFLHMGGSNNDPGTIVVSAGSSTPVSYLKTDLKSSILARPWISTSFVEGLYFHEGNCGYPGTYFGWLKVHSESGEFFEPFAVSEDEINAAPEVFGSCQHWSYESWRNCPPFAILNQNAFLNANQLMLGLILDYAFSLKSQILDLIDDQMTSSKKVVITGGGANEFLGRILQTILGSKVQIINSDECAKNLLHLISTGSARETSPYMPLKSFDAKITDSLLRLEKDHAEDYLSIEGSREMIRNVV